MTTWINFVGGWPCNRTLGGTSSHHHIPSSPAHVELQGMLTLVTFKCSGKYHTCYFGVARHIACTLPTGSCAGDAYWAGWGIVLHIVHCTHVRRDGQGTDLRCTHNDAGTRQEEVRSGHTYPCKGLIKSSAAMCIAYCHRPQHCI